MTKISDIEWKPLPNWQVAHLMGMESTPGLIRFILNGEVVYIGMESVGLSNFRRFCTEGGSAANHHAGRKIVGEREHLIMEYAVVDLPRHKLKSLRDKLIENFSPEFNVSDGS